MTDKMRDNGAGYVWYACYGSNINKERFMRYIVRCTDTSEPVEEKAFTLPYDIYFAASSRIWDGGAVAFLDDSREGMAYGKIYKITSGQYEEVKAMEGAWYTKKVDLGQVDGLPVYTFTDVAVREDKGLPADSYFNTILEGLVQLHGEDLRGEMTEYLKKATEVETL